MNYENFNSLGLDTKVLKAIETLGFEKPSKIQKEIIPLILSGYDCLGQAQTGTGKTLAFAASILSKINVTSNIVKAIVVVPTRELALQVSEEFEALNTSSKFNILAVFGGSSIELQLRALKKGVDIVVGTPGRIGDLIDRRVLKLDNIEFFVLDEADEMLNMGFEEDIHEIFKKTPTQKQVLLFSATMPKAILALASTYMKEDYQNIAVIEKSDTAINVSQNYYLVNDKIRTEALCRIIDAKSPNLALIFCQRKSDVDILLTELAKRNYNAEAMHGDIAQNMRIKTLERFKEGAFTYLIATDVAARGIHVNNIDLVINYNLPQDVEAYIHRIGRTGRAGKTGEAISLVTPREVRFLEDVQRIAKCTINKAELPDFAAIVEAKYQKIIIEVNKIIDNKGYEECLSYVRDMNKEDLIQFSAGLLKNALNKEIGSDFNKEFTVKEHYDRRDMVSKNATRVFLTVGTMDGIKKGSLLDFLKETTQIDKSCFNNVEVLKKFSFIDVDNKVIDELIRKINNKKYKSHTIRIEKAGKKK